MIIFNIIPNQKLRENLASKMSVVLMRMDEIPAYDPVENKKHFSMLVKEGKSFQLTETILKNIKKIIVSLEKEMLHYLKNHTANEESIEPVFTIWFYDNQRKEYGYIQKSIPDKNGSSMTIDKDFFKTLKGKNFQKTKLIELIIIDIMIFAYQLMNTERYELIGLKEWENEIKKGKGGEA